MADKPVERRDNTIQQVASMVGGMIIAFAFGIIVQNTWKLSAEAVTKAYASDTKIAAMDQKVADHEKFVDRSIADIRADVSSMKADLRTAVEAITTSVASLRENIHRSKK